MFKKLAFIIVVFLAALTVRALAFISPTGGAGTTGGQIQTDADGNIGVNVAPATGVKFQVQGATSDSGTYSFKVLNSGSGAIFSVRSDGVITISSTTNLSASGIRFSDGTTQTTASTGGGGGGVTSTPAGYVTPGAFNSVAGTGGNYSFPASLSIGTSTVPSAGVLFVNGSVGIGTASPGYKLDVAGGGRFTGTLLANGGINMNSADISAVNKLTVTTIDPLYRIGGVNYATYAGSFAGGVKEEYSGKAKFAPVPGSGEYEYVIDFEKEPVGSDLWVWYRAVDFAAENVEAVATPYGRFANIYYVVDGSKLIFRSDKEAEFSFRLTGRRHDWREWPTKAINQTEAPSFIIK